MVYPNAFWKPRKEIAQLNFGKDSLWLRFSFCAHKSEISNRQDTALSWFTHLGSTLGHVGRDAGGRQPSSVHPSRWGPWVYSSGKMSSFNFGISAFPSCGCDTVFPLKHRDIRRLLMVLISIYAPPTLLHLPFSTPRPRPTSWASKRVLLQTRRADPSRGIATLTLTERSLFLSCLFLAWRTKTERGVLIFLVSLLQLAALPISNISCDVTVFFFNSSISLYAILWVIGWEFSLENFWPAIIQ